MRIIANAPVKGIIQVGANDGGELASFAEVSSNLLLFEPVEQARRVLEQRAAALPPSVRIAVSDLIVSDHDGEVDFFVGRESGNSSMFDLNPARPAAHHHNVHDRRVRRRSVTLDAFFAEQRGTLSPADYNYLYMDVQGAEHLVLQGATGTLRHIDFIWMEVSYAPIYLNTMMFWDMCHLCESLGYFLAFHEESPWNQNQGDALFVRDERFPQAPTH
jgi:FkbM family methyltransferase